jgi:hypothetical protein
MYLGVFKDNYYSPENVMPEGSYSSIAGVNSGTLAAKNLVGGVSTYVTVTTAANLTTDTATNILAALTALGVPPTIGPNPYVGTSWLINVRNQISSSGTLTLTGGTGVTITGTATVAYNYTRTYIATVNGPGLLGLQDVGAVATT